MGCECGDEVGRQVVRGKDLVDGVGGGSGVGDGFVLRFLQCRVVGFSGDAVSQLILWQMASKKNKGKEHSLFTLRSQVPS